MARKIQYYENVKDGPWCYFISGKKNPCGCGSNCFHQEQDTETGNVYGVCNVCKRDIYQLEGEEHIQEELSKGVWKEVLK